MTEGVCARHMHRLSQQRSPQDPKSSGSEVRCVGDAEVMHVGDVAGKMLVGAEAPTR